MAASTMQGLLSLKKKSGVSDSWSSSLCEYIETTNVLTVKSKDGNSTFWERPVEGAWPLEAKANRRPGRFDVLCSDGQTVAFAAPTNGDMVRWVEALHSGAILADGSPTADPLGSAGKGALIKAGSPVSDSFDIAGDEVDSEIATAAGQTLSLPVEEPTLLQHIWKANFAQFLMRDDVAGPDLQPSEFFELVNEVLSSHAGVASESEASPEPPSDSDLEACFTLADDDKSGKISEGEFVRLMGLIVEGGVKGLGSSSGGNHRSSSGLAPEHMKFKTDLRKAEAKDARNHALALSAEASAMALEAQKAARHAASERHKSNPPEMALGGAEQEWRKKFAEAANGGEGLDCTKFVLLVKKVLLKDFMQSQSSSSKSGGKITAGFDMPSDSDLDSAFSIADADESGIVDEGEFLRLMVLIRAGKIEGLGTSSFFSFGSSSAADKEASFKAEIEAAKAAVPSSVLDAELAAKAAAVKAKAAIAAAKLAESSAKAIQEKVANNGTNAAPQATGDVKVSAAFGSNEMKNSKDSVVTNSAAHNFGLGMHGPSSSKFGQNVTINTSSVIAQVDMTARDILSAQGVDLGHFVLPLHLHGVDTAEELKGCSNTWLAIHAELSAPAHLTKLRRVVADTTYSMPHTASDGFKGSTEAEIAAHEAKLRDLRQLASKDDASDRGPESKEVEGHESKLGKRLLASRGPVPKDSTNEVPEMAKKEGEQNISARDRKMWHLYEAPDGFRGTYDEVLAYEKKFGFMDGNHDDNAQKQSAGMVYEASDGFCGTYEEVLTHEKTVPTRAGDVANDTGKDSYLYKCSDGFHGSYQDCLVHEKNHGLDVQWHKSEDVQTHLNSLHGEMTALQAEAAELRSELEALESK